MEVWEWKNLQGPLTEDEREELKKIISKGKHKSQKVTNSLVLRGCDEGEYQEKRSTNTEIYRVLKKSMRKKWMLILKYTW